jgi:hypothetical protein
MLVTSRARCFRLALLQAAQLYLHNLLLRLRRLLFQNVLPVELGHTLILLMAQPLSLRSQLLFTRSLRYSKFFLVVLDFCVDDRLVFI